MIAIDADAPIVIEGATLIDGTGAPPLPNATVVVADGRIASVCRASDECRPEGAVVLAAHGKWLVPGLIDAHAHAGPSWTLMALLAMGVTTIRKPGPAGAGDLDVKGACTEPSPGPDVIRAGPPIDYPPGTFRYAVCVATEAEARSAVREQAEVGVDIVKLYVRLPPLLVRAAVAEAHALGIRAMGDLRATSWTDAARAGIDYLAHAVPRHPSLLPADVRESYRADTRAGRVSGHCRWIELVEFDSAEIAEMIDALREHRVVVDPTLVSFEALFFGADRAFRKAVLPWYWLLPEGVRADFAPPATEHDPDAELLARYRAAWSKLLGFIKLLFDRGVSLIAGTDTPRPWVVPGASLHRELSLLVDAGLSPLEALRAATAESAAALGIGEDRGIIAKGKRADLVLLGRDPLERIANSTCVEWVMKAGVRFVPEELRMRYS